MTPPATTAAASAAAMAALKSATLVLITAVGTALADKAVDATVVDLIMFSAARIAARSNTCCLT